MKRLFSKRMLISVCVVTVALFIVRLPASRLRDKVLHSMGAALGRNIEVGSLRIRLLPRPCFELGNLVIHDDPAFGAEPLLRAADVTASLQVTALLRGRLAISALSLSDASVNLARNPAGQWNVEDLLQRTSKITVAPTASGRQFSRPQFPYIEATGARINFKTGNEKTHFALTDAKFGLWQDSENTWGMRLQARPIRTNANLTDTGTINVSGNWRRSAVLRETPLRLSFEWQQAQIGQISKLIYGIDKGWRGSALLSGEIAGTPQNLTITADASVDDFRRQDVFGDNNLRLAVHCGAEYSVSGKTISNLDCVAPSGNGLLELKGNASSGSGMQFSSYDLWLIANGVPAQSILALVRHANGRLAVGLVANGRVDGNVSLHRVNAGPVRLEANGQVQELRLSSKEDGELAVGTVPVSLVSVSSKPSLPKRPSKVRTSHAPKALRYSNSDDSPEQPRIELGPVNVPLGRSNPVQVSASFSKSGYQAWIRGDAGVKRLLQSARVVGIPVPAVNAEGGSSVDLHIAGIWTGDRPAVSGTAQLRSVHAQVRGTNEPISINNANLIIDDELVKVLNLNASAAGATWRGSLRIPRPCAAPEDCEVQFDLRTPELTSGALNRFFNPALQKTAWYKIFSSSQKSRYLLRARANGTIQIDDLVLGKTKCSHLISGVRLDEGRVTLSGLEGEILGGNISGNWNADFNAKPPTYRGSGSVNDLSLAEVSDLMNDSWIEGTGEAKYEFSAAGWTLRDLLSSADLGATFSVSNGNFPHVVLTSISGPLHARSFAGDLRLHDGQISFHDAKLTTAREVYTVAGTASLNGALNLKISRERIPGFFISGTLLETRVSSNPTTAASLKP